MTQPRTDNPVLRWRVRRGFTLVELIVAAILIAMLVGATYVAVSQTLRARDRSESRGAASRRAGLAADIIAADLGMAIRAAELTEAKLAITRTGPPGRGVDGLLFFSHIATPVRLLSGQPEGDECETQFRLESSPGQPAQYTLWRRRQPVPDAYPDAGGVAVPLVDGLKAVTIDAYDGTSWRDSWDSDNDGFPHAVRLVVTASSDSGDSTSVARRVIAFDRTPIPPPATDTSNSTTTTAPSTGSTTR